MYIRLYILLMISSLYSCKNKEQQDSDLHNVAVNQISTAQKEIEKIDSCMKAQELAWNEGNIEVFMAGYWPSDSLCFVGKSGLNKGWNKTLENYRKSYPDKEAMGRLLFENLQYKAIEQHHFLVIGKWTLFRTEDTLTGHYSLVWQKMANKWIIIADHSS